MRMISSVSNPLSRWGSRPVAKQAANTSLSQQGRVIGLLQSGRPADQLDFSRTPSLTRPVRFSGWIPPRVGVKPEISIQTMQAAFKFEYSQRQPEAIYFAPGRFTLLSSDTESFGGYVLAGAHPQGAYAAIQPREDAQIRVYTMNTQKGPDRLTVYLNHASDSSWDDWRDYATMTVREVQRALHDRGIPLMKGADIVVGSDVDLGAAAASSTALSNVLALALLESNGVSVNSTDERLKLAEISRRVERQVGKTDSYTDPLASALAEEGKLLLIKGGDSEAVQPGRIRALDLKLPDDKTFLLIYTGKTEKNRASSAASLRHKSNADALKVLQEQPAFKNCKSLCDIAPSELKQHRTRLSASDPNLFRWAFHAVTENHRTRKGARLLKQGRWEALGRLMNQSHLSSRNNYGVSSPELEVAFHTVNRIPGVYGAQLIGPGLGGNLLVLLDKSAVEEVKSQVKARFERVFVDSPLKPTFTELRGGSGPRRIWEKSAQVLETPPEPSSETAAKTPPDAPESKAKTDLYDDDIPF